MRVVLEGDVDFFSATPACALQRVVDEVSDPDVKTGLARSLEVLAGPEEDVCAEVHISLVEYEEFTHLTRLLKAREHVVSYLIEAARLLLHQPRSALKLFSAGDIL
jgi:hypothetical protein